MYILKNAWVSIKRNKGRNILMGVIIIVIACAATVTLAIRNSANTLIDSYESSQEITANISVNRQNMMQMFRPGEERGESTATEITSPTKEDYESYADSDYVKSFYYTETVGMNAKDIEPVEFDFESLIGENSNGGGRRVEINTNRVGATTDFTLSAYSSVEAMQEFLEGRYKIVDGSVSDDFEGYTCVINQELATTNELQVGDTITIVNPNNSSLIYELTITGIFEEKDESENNMMNFITTSANFIVTNTTVVEKIVSDDEDLNSTITPTYVLTDLEAVDAFTEEVTDKGLDEMYTVSTNAESIENETLSIKNVSTYVVTFLIITLLIGGIVLFIINLINVRERKYEIGVLRTIGMKKSKVSLQFVTELLIISVVALFIGFGIGSFMSVPVANKMLANEIETQEAKQEDISGNFGGMQFGNGPSFSVESDNGGRRTTSFSPVNNIQYISEINAAVDFKVLLQLLGLGLLLSVVSSTAAMTNIAKFKPLTILKERT